MPRITSLIVDFELEDGTNAHFTFERNALGEFVHTRTYLDGDSAYAKGAADEVLEALEAREGLLATHLHKVSR